MSEDIVDVLRAFGSAYQEKFFRPLTEADREYLHKDNLDARSAAEMGRYLATWMTQAADEIERLRFLIKGYRAATTSDPHSGDDDEFWDEIMDEDDVGHPDV